MESYITYVAGEYLSISKSKVRIFLSSGIFPGKNIFYLLCCEQKIKKIHKMTLKENKQK